MEIYFVKAGNLAEGIKDVENSAYEYIYYSDRSAEHYSPAFEALLLGGCHSNMNSRRGLAS